MAKRPPLPDPTLRQAIAEVLAGPESAATKLARIRELVDVDLEHGMGDAADDFDLAAVDVDSLTVDVYRRTSYRLSVAHAVAAAQGHDGDGPPSLSDAAYEIVHWAVNPYAEVEQVAGLEVLGMTAVLVRGNGMPHSVLGDWGDIEVPNAPPLRILHA
jgi:hypothetical protein